MKVSEAWLREWVSPSLTVEALARQLTMAGLEVEALIPAAGSFHQVVVGFVTQTMPHPQADKLTLCEIDVGTGTLLKVVCGASNVRKNLKVAVALPGAHLPGDFIIKESILRGQVSQGMLCSRAELGLEERSDGILELPSDAPIGVDVRDFLQLNDTIFEINLTPNRADCFSMLGVAREVAALNHLPLKKMHSESVVSVSNDILDVDLQAVDACPRYASRIIRGINSQAETPLWMMERLRRAGFRCVHPVVDVTNYVMLELGQPMHAFDLQAIEGSIQVRYAASDETLVLLDGQSVALDNNVLVISDAQKPLAIAGVMGGLVGSVQANTTDIVLESAFFSPRMLAGVARRYGLSSESSQRFERGVDPELQVVALERATQLLQSIVAGTTGSIQVMTAQAHLPLNTTIAFNPQQVNKLTGLDISLTEMASMLQRLGMNVVTAESIWEVSVPSWRFDLHLDVDLVEEITRLYGYDNIPSHVASSIMQAGLVNPLDQLSRKFANLLVGRGYYEAISYSFIDPEFQKAISPNTKTMRLLNPISSELSEMRASLWPGLLASMIHNSNRQQTTIQLFELGVVFGVDDNKVHENASIAGLLTGEKGCLNWSEASGLFDFYDMKGDVQALLASIPAQSIHFVADNHPALHPGQSARILVNQESVGWIGVLHPRLMDELDLAQDVILFELVLKPLLHSTTHRYKKISKYPQIRRDLSLLVDMSVTAFQIEQSLRLVAPHHLLKAVDVFDVYMGQSIPVGKKSLAIALTLQDDTRTLIDEEIHAIVQVILKQLEDDFAVILRDTTT